MPYASVNGFRMFYNARGEGEVVVFIHGGFPSLDMHLRAQSSGMWGWETDFTSDFRFVIYDRRGCWLSSRPEGGYDIENQARDLAELLGHLEVERAHLIGSSAGGPVAVLFATIYPERVNTLVLAGTAANLWPEEDPITAIVKEQVEILEKQDAAAAWKNRPKGVELSLDILWEREEMKERGTLREYEERIQKLVERSTLMERVQWYGTQLQAIGAYLRRDVIVECGRIGAPTLVVHGDKDREVPVDWGRDLAMRIPGAEFRMYPDESHSPVHRSVGVREDLMAFFRKKGIESPGNSGGAELA